MSDNENMNDLSGESIVPVVPMPEMPVEDTVSEVASGSEVIADVVSETTNVVDKEAVSETVIDTVVAEFPSENDSAETKLVDVNGSSEDVKTVEVKTSDKDKTAESKIKKTTIGGQALIEGIMMCGPKVTAMAVRKGDGTIHIEEMKQSDRVSYFGKVPFVRGCIKFYKMLVTGTDATMKSADISEQGKPETEEEKNKKPSRLDEYMSKHYNLVLTLSAILGIALSIGLFILLPRFAVDLVRNLFDENTVDTIGVSILLNCIEGVLRILIFLIYLLSVSKIPDIARVWMYHGAEHKTIACYEARLPLTVENIKKQVRFHPRCGTAFMFIVLMISILIYTITGVFIGDNNMWINLLVRLIFIPIICGISYEILRFVGRHSDSGICKVLCKPGLWLQKFTTKEPDDAIIEVAIAAMQAVIPENDNEDNW